MSLAKLLINTCATIKCTNNTNTHAHTYKNTKESFLYILGAVKEKSEKRHTNSLHNDTLTLAPYRLVAAADPDIPLAAVLIRMHLQAPHTVIGRIRGR